MKGEIYRRPILFTFAAAGAVLIGSIITAIFPIFTEQMHPRLENLKPFTALQLAGRDMYQREGCINCHTQTVRPLKTEVMRYGEYSKAGEFAYDHPFLWGSKRTGPDLARIGGKYPDAWHYRHFENPRKFFAESNMPSYAWLKGRIINPSSIKKHMDALGFPYSDEDIHTLNEKDELDALVAYMQIIGTSIKKRPAGAVEPEVIETGVENPFAGDPEAIARGKDLYEENCALCHGDNGEGDIGPSLIDDVFLYAKGDLADDDYYKIIHNGTEEGKTEEERAMKGGMPPFGGELQKNEIWSIISFIRSIQGK